MTRILARAGWLCATLASTVVLISACATPVEPDVETTARGLDIEGIDLGAYAEVTAQLDFERGTVVLPLDGIRKDSAEVTALRLHARQALVDSCLRERGLPGVEWPAMPPADGDRLFGPWSVALASRYGFGMARDALNSAGPPDRTDEQSQCIASAKEEMAGLGESADTYSLDKQIRSTAYDAVKVSPEAKAAISAAQACMVENGIAIDSESGMPRSDPSASNSETNIRIAVTSATCYVETGAIQTLYDRLAQYQAALIDKNEAAVVELAREKDELIAGYQEIIDANK